MSRFEKGKSYVFDKGKFEVDNDGIRRIERNWVNLCDQRAVQVLNSLDGEIYIDDSTYLVVPEWCHEVTKIKEVPNE